jgi:hypothetical protein
MTHSEGSVPSPTRNAATGFSAEWGHENQHNQNTFQIFREKWIFYVSISELP